MQSKLEQRLWWQIRATLGPQCWASEYRFHVERRWRFDFAYLPLKLGIECEGGTWTNGRHTRGKGFEGDCEKYNAAVEAGWQVLRYTDKQIRAGNAIAQIERIIKRGHYEQATA